MGRANWWTPKALRGLYNRYGIREIRDDLATGEIKSLVTLSQ
jgi:hypothetical protein